MTVGDWIGASVCFAAIGSVVWGVIAGWRMECADDRVNRSEETR